MTDEVEWLEPQPGPSTAPVSPLPRRRPGWLLLVAAVTTGVAVTIASHSTHGSAPAVSTAPAVVGAPVVLADLGRPLLGSTERADLYARTASAVVRVQLSRGRVTATSLPPLGSGGPVSFVALPSGVLVRPLDLVPGYFIPDTGRGTVLSGRLVNGPALPGPQPGQLWVTDNSGGSTSASQLVLLAANGSTVNSLRIPTSAFGPPTADGQGYLLVKDPAGGVRDVRPTASQQVVRNGVVLAVGADEWLTAACHGGGACPVTVVSSGGADRSLAAQPVGELWPTGRISPDGSRAAVFRGVAGGRLAVTLLDLRTGSSQPTSMRVGANADADSIAFSPDSSWLFVADANGSLKALNVDTGVVQGLGVGNVEGVLQVAVRG